MCTLTIFHGKKRCVVTMNRDELRTRRESGQIHSRSGGQDRLFYPVDVNSGGTWFGINSQGAIMALLNRYQGHDKTNAPSRGIIIPAALQQGGFSAISTWLGKFDARPFNTFDLFLVGKRRARRYTWDGRDWGSQDLEFKHWYMFTSSYIQAEEVVAFRQNFFNAWSGEMGKKLIGTDEILRGFHLIQIDGMETQSVLMERERSHTKSIIQADIQEGQLTLKYYPDVIEKALDNVQVEQVVLRR